MPNPSRPSRSKARPGAAANGSHLPVDPSLATAVANVLAELRAAGSPENIAGMARFGITSGIVYGVAMPATKAMAKRLGRNQALAEALWNTGIHDARILAAHIAEPKRVTRATLNAWVQTLDNWAVCDNLCTHLVRKTPFVLSLIEDWARQEPEFVRRAGFSLLAYLAVHDKKRPDEEWPTWLALCEEYADDDRNFVKKAVNWAIRQIGKRNEHCCLLAMACCRRLSQRPSAAARWVARDALRELTKQSG